MNRIKLAGRIEDPSPLSVRLSSLYKMKLKYSELSNRLTA